LSPDHVFLLLKR